MDVVLKLPEELVRQAQAAGILTDEQIARFLQTELERRQRRQTLFEDIGKLRDQHPSLTPNEIEAELKAFRQTRTSDRST